MIRGALAIVRIGIIGGMLVGVPRVGATPVVATVDAASPASASGDATTSVTDPLTVTVSGDPWNRVGQPMFITIQVKNVSAGTVLIKNLNISIDHVSADRFAETKCEWQQHGELTLAPGLSFEQSCRFEMNPLDLWASFRSLREALWSAEIRFDVKANINRVGERHFYPSLIVKAQEFSIFIGGMVGALLLAIFVWIERVLTNPAVREAWLRSLGFTALMGIRGGIMAIIALLLGKTTQGGGSPISLTVSDFTGGLMVGLFSYPFASWISSALKLDDVVLSRSIKKGRLPDTDAGAGRTPSGDGA